mmetsp:Transcript_53178/g.134346  ORF Transcript_53178/g.134346 Transcript_53178/m.134346 type:complete len:244 (+) Transcript_53178:315-1046(+)
MRCLISACRCRCRCHGCHASRGTHHTNPQLWKGEPKRFYGTASLQIERPSRRRRSPQTNTIRLRGDTEGDDGAVAQVGLWGAVGVIDPETSVLSGTGPLMVARRLACAGDASVGILGVGGLHLVGCPVDGPRSCRGDAGTAGTAAEMLPMWAPAAELVRGEPGDVGITGAASATFLVGVPPAKLARGEPGDAGIALVGGDPAELARGARNAKLARGVRAANLGVAVAAVEGLGKAELMPLGIC